MSFEGIDIRQAGDRLVLRAFLTDADGNPIATGTALLYLYEVQSDGSLKSFDWDDYTFKTGTLTIETRPLAHRTGNNGATNTGLWTLALAALSGFTPGNIYIAKVSHDGAYPKLQCREFQYGGRARLGPHSKSRFNVATGQLEWFDEDGATVLATLPMVEASGQVTVG